MPARSCPKFPPQVLAPRVSGGAVLNRTVGAPESQGLQGATAGLAGQALQGAIGGTAGLSTELDPSAAASTGPPAPASARAPPAVAPAPGVHATAAAAARAASPPAAGPSVVLAARDDSEFLRKFTETGRQLCSPTFCMGISLIHFVWGFLSYILYGDFSHTFCMGIYLSYILYGDFSHTFCMGISLIHFVWGFLSYILYGTLPSFC